MTDQAWGAPPDRLETPAAPSRVPVRIPAERLPACLSDLRYGVEGLWLLGDGEILGEAPAACVAIVGTRDASPYGERTARRLAKAAARAGLVVISGLARGVDAAAHEAAIEAGGRTIAVLGTGVDVPYPAGHRNLHRLVQENGAVLSESEPGTRAFPGCFPRRNRIIAALATMTVVVEAGFKSGAINTATQALELGRTVAAVPGLIDDPRAAGANLLLRDGAQVLTDVEDLLALCGKTGRNGSGVEHGSGNPDVAAWVESPIEAQLLSMVGPSPTSAEDLAFTAGLSVGQIAGILLRLEVCGLIRQERGGYRRAG